MTCNYFTCTRWKDTYLNTHGWSHLTHHGNKIKSFTLVSVHIQYQPVTKRNRSDNLLFDSLLAPVSLRTRLECAAAKNNLLQRQLTTFGLEKTHKA